jgi:peroxiredoxin
VAINKGRTSTGSSTSTLAVGDAAPAIVLPAHNAEKPWSLADAKGKSKVVLAFFPFAFTPV